MKWIAKLIAYELPKSFRRKEPVIFLSLRTTDRNVTHWVEMRESVDWYERACASVVPGLKRYWKKQR